MSLDNIFSLNGMGGTLPTLQVNVTGGVDTLPENDRLSKVHKKLAFIQEINSLKLQKNVSTLLLPSAKNQGL